jgi:alpha-beta hydrolase superfamily lysophospholipase
VKRRAALIALGASALAACQPVSQRAGQPNLGFAGPHLAPDALISFDGTRLPMHVWTAQDASGAAVEPWAVVVGLHGMNDYAEAFSLAGPAWAAQGITTYAYDQRGFGRAPERGVWGGEALMVEDLRTALTLARARHPHAILCVVGESMGGAVAISAFASDNPPVADRVILAAPAVWGWDAQAIPNRVLLWLAAHVAPSYKLVTPGWLARRIRASDNIDELRRMGRDRNMIFDTRIDTVYGLVGLMQRARQDLGKVKAPVLYLYGAKDQIIPKAAAVYAARELKPTDRSAFYPNGYHLLTRDLDRRLVWGDIISFIHDPSAPLPSGVPPIPQAPTPPNAPMRLNAPS